jgi:NDP-sugar pyrophosphorylase family protein
MQAVILAAGRGTRMVELTTTVPKPMLEVEGKPLLEYKLEALPDEIDEAIIIVGYLAKVIRDHFGGSYAGKRITFLEQKELNGTAGALWLAKDMLCGRGGSAPGGKDRYLVMMGDDIYAREDVEACIAQGEGWRLVVQALPHMHRAGDVELAANGTIEAIIEGDLFDKPGIASTNMFCLDTRLFTQPMVPKQEGSLEFGLPQTVLAASKSLGIRFEPIFTDKWIQITAPKDLVVAAEMLKKLKK